MIRGFKQTFDTLFDSLNQGFGLDLRSLALMRMGLAIMIMVDLSLRLPDLKAFYTDAGVIPRTYLLTSLINQWAMSFHLMTGIWQGELILFLLAYVLALLLLVGFRTGWMTFFSWLFLVSLQNRNPGILCSGDVLLRMILFWSMFLPLGARYSVDAALNTKPLSQTRVFNFPALFYMIQVSLVYWVSGFCKTGAEWIHDNTALYYALRLEPFRTALGTWMIHFPRLLVILTVGTILLERWGPFLFFIPWKGRPRLFAIFLFILLHLGIIFALYIGTFPWIDIVSLLALLPTSFWTFVSTHIHTPQPVPLQVYYDGDCRFCKKLLLLLHTFLILPAGIILPAQSDPHYSSLMASENSWIVVVENAPPVFRYEAFLVLLEQSPVFWPLARCLKALPLNPFANRCYTWIANHREQLSARLTWLRFRPVTVSIPIFAQGIAVYCMVCVALYNVYVLNSKLIVPPALLPTLYMLRLDQSWNMFSPIPPKNDGWFSIRGRLADQSSVNLLEPEKPFRFDKPEWLMDVYKNQYWQKYLMTMALPSASQDTMIHYSRYLCQTWNDVPEKQHPQKMYQVDIYYNDRLNLPDFKSTPPTVRVLMRYQCLRNSVMLN